MDQKRQLREQAERRRRSVSLPSGHLFSEAAQTLADTLGAQMIAAYYPFGTEPDLSPFVQQLDRVLIPRLYAPHGTVLSGVAGLSEVAGRSGVADGSWGIRESGQEWAQPRVGAPLQPALAAPSQALLSADLILVPALLADESGTRLGRGGGWYDRALAELTAPIYAVVYSWEVLPAGTLPAESHDVPVDGVVTEVGAREFAR